MESVYNCSNKTNCDYIKNESNIIKLKSFVKKHYIKFISVFVVIGFICGITALLIPKNVHLSVTGVYWERSIDVEKYQTVDESDWTLPSNARLKYERLEVYDYVDVLDHYETQTKYIEKERIIGYEEKVVGYNDLGNGYFEEETYTKPIYREETVYKTKYYYEINKWLYERSIKISGNNKDVYWGEIDLKETERTASKHEKYFVYGKDSNQESFEFYLDYNKWSDIQIGNEYEVNISIGGKGEIIN